jgi:hypothetical protein
MNSHDTEHDKQTTLDTASTIIHSPKGTPHDRHLSNQIEGPIGTQVPFICQV